MLRMLFGGDNDQESLLALLFYLAFRRDYTTTHMPFWGCESSSHPTQPSSQRGISFFFCHGLLFPGALMTF